MINQRPGRLLHDACVYGSDQEFLAMAVPFVDDGVESGDPVLAVTTPRNIALLRDSVAAPEAVEYIDCADWYVTPGRTAATYYERVRTHAGPGRARVIGEVVWAGRSQEEIGRWKRYESGLNVMFEDIPAWIVCPYDTRALSPELIDAALRTHPGRLEGVVSRVCDAYVEPDGFIGDREAATVPDPPLDAALITYASLHDLRRAVTAWTASHGSTGGDRTTALAAAVCEAVTYLIQEGADDARVRMWSPDGAIACQVDTARAGIGDPLAGYRPPRLSPRAGDRVWLTRYVCDVVEIVTDTRGCRIRMELASQ